MPVEARHGTDDGMALCAHPLALAVLSAFLKTGRMIDQTSSVLLLGTIILLIGVSLSVLVASGICLALLFACVEKYYAWRVALDAELFAVLYKHGDEVNRFDAALAQMLGAAPPVAERPMASRWSGAKRLLLRQVIFLALQALAVGFAMSGVRGFFS